MGLRLLLIVDDRFYLDRTFHFTKMRRLKPITTNDLVPNLRNPRKITDEQIKALRKSLQAFGDLSGIIFNERSNRLVGGHQRIEAVCDKNYTLTKSKVYAKPAAVGTSDES